MPLPLVVILLFLWLAVTVLPVGHVLLNKRNPRGAALWTLLILMLPLLGPFLYWILGINRIRRKSRSRARRKGPAAIPYPPQVVQESVPADLALPGLDRLAQGAVRRPLMPGNLVEPLYEGNRAFPAMFEAIGRAQRSVTLSTYILDRDAVGQRMVDSLCSAVQRGVQVRVLVDGIGTSGAGLRMASRLRRAGARLAVFHPLLGLPLRRPGLNMRNHRKILVVDGQEGFSGGINISATHFFSRHRRREGIRDVHFRIRGPVVNSMQEVFAEDWLAATGELLEGDRFYGKQELLGNALARAVASGPDENLEKIYELVLGALRSARHRVLIITPYFLPDRPIVQALRTAVLSGVQVRLLLPLRSDHLVVSWASNAFLGELVSCGVEVAMVPPPFVHSKLIVADRTWSLVGSANLDPRSFRLNFEFDLEIYNRELAAELELYGDRLTEGARFLTPSDLSSRPLTLRLLEGAAKLLSPHL